MSKSQLEETINGLSRYARKNAPKILLGAGIGAGFATTVLSVWATPKAIQLIEEKKKEEKVVKLTLVDTVKTVWVCYIPAALTGAMSLVCLILSSKATDHQMSALITAYTISETTLRDYKAKVIEAVGPKKEEAIRDSMAKDEIAKHPMTSAPVFMTGRGNSLFYDPITKTYFYSDIEKIRQGVNRLNNRLNHEWYLTLNDFYEELGLDPWIWGDNVGWNANKGLIDLVFSAQLTDSGDPCVVIGFRVGPYWDYDK